MKNKILIAASIGLSLFAAAQSQTDKQKPKPSTTQTQSPRDLASGQASGRSVDQQTKNSPVIHRDVAPRDIATGHSSGKKTAQDDWHQQSAAKPVSSTSETKTESRVAVGDVNGDGVADVAASKNSAHASESLSTNGTSPAKVQAPRDAASGQATGKRQHQPMTIVK